MKEFTSRTCPNCLQERECKEFSEWIEDTSKAMRCDFCHELAYFDKIMQNNATERNARKKLENELLTQKQINSVKSKETMSKLAVRRAIELRNEQKLIDDLIGV